MTDKIHVVMAADQAYWKGLEVAQASMIASCSVPERLAFHLFGEDEKIASRIRADFGTYKGSPMAFVRLYLGELLPDVDWVVYSDVDTLWYRDVAELWELRDETKTIQWVRDIESTRKEAMAWQRKINPQFSVDRYGCSGIMLINLKRFRERRLLDAAVAFTKRNGLFKYVDQDILNALCCDDGGFLPPWWNVLIPTPINTQATMAGKGHAAIACVLHLNGVGRCFNRPYEGHVLQYHFWEHVAKGKPFKRPWSLPFYLRGWMIRVLLPFAGPFFRDRVQRYFAYRWLFRKKAFPFEFRYRGP